MPEDHPLVRAYLRRFDAVAARLPQERREQLRGEVSAHLGEAIDIDMSDEGVRAVIEELGDPVLIVADEADEKPDTVRRSWIVGGGLLLLSVVIAYVAQYVDVLGLPLQAVVWGAGVVVLAVAPASITARRPLGTSALIGLAAWTVVYSVLAGAVNASASAHGDLTPSVVLSLVDTFGGFVLAVVAAVQIARIEVVPRPWRWAALWVLVAVTATWLLAGVAGTIAVSTSPTVFVGFGMLEAATRAGGTLLLGTLAVLLGAGLLRRRTIDP